MNRIEVSQATRARLVPGLTVTQVPRRRPRDEGRARCDPWGLRTRDSREVCGASSLTCCVVIECSHRRRSALSIVTMSRARQVDTREALVEKPLLSASGRHMRGDTGVGAPATTAPGAPAEGRQRSAYGQCVTVRGEPSSRPYPVAVLEQFFEDEDERTTEEPPARRRRRGRRAFAAFLALAVLLIFAGAAGSVWYPIRDWQYQDR